MIATMAVIVPIALIIVFNGDVCNVRNVIGPNYDDFITIVGFKNSAALSI